MVLQFFKNLTANDYFEASLHNLKCHSYKFDFIARRLQYYRLLQCLYCGVLESSQHFYCFFSFSFHSRRSTQRAVLSVWCGIKLWSSCIHIVWADNCKSFCYRESIHYFFFNTIKTQSSFSPILTGSTFAVPNTLKFVLVSLHQSLASQYPQVICTVIIRSKKHHPKLTAVVRIMIRTSMVIVGFSLLRPIRIFSMHLSRLGRYIHSFSRTASFCGGSLSWMTTFVRQSHLLQACKAEEKLEVVLNFEKFVMFDF